MPALSIAKEYEAVRLAIQSLTTTATNTVSFNIGDLSVTYNAAQLPWLEKREIELARRLSQRDIRKRTTPDFT